LASDPLAAGQKLLLRAALDEPEDALRYFAEWWNLVDIQHISGAEHRILPLIYKDIGRLIPDKFAAETVKGVAKHAWLSQSWHECSQYVYRDGQQ
jgi:hypothetical protein